MTNIDLDHLRRALDNRQQDRLFSQRRVIEYAAEEYFKKQSAQQTAKTPELDLMSQHAALLEKLIEKYILTTGCSIDDIQLSQKDEGNGKTSYSIEPKTYRENPTALTDDKRLAAFEDFSGHAHCMGKPGDKYMVGCLKPETYETIRASLQSGPAVKEGWNFNMDEAPRDGTSVLILMKDDLLPFSDDGRLENLQGIQFVGRARELSDTGYDFGWSFAAPVGYGGIPNKWIKAWQHLPAAPEVE